MTQPSGAGPWVKKVIGRLGDRAIHCIYEREVLPLRTRTVRLFGRKCRPEVIYTFLGYELKARGRRLTCPDETTVRYLKVFGELGMDQVRIPLDPTQTARHLDGLEAALTALRDAVRQRFPAEPKKQEAALRALYAWTRRQLKSAP